MSKIILIWVAIIAMIPCHAVGKNAPNYEITINGKTHDISLDYDYEIKSDSGETLQIRINKKPVITFENGNLSFQHKNDLTVSTTDLGNGIHQTLTNTAVGTLILFQEYSSMNPTSLVNLMLQELTKEQRNYGYKMQKEAHSKALKDGTKLTGKIATLKYNNEEEYWTVVAYGKKDQGVLVIIKIDKEYLDSEKNIIDLMWDTLQIKL